MNLIIIIVILAVIALAILAILIIAAVCASRSKPRETKATPTQRVQNPYRKFYNKKQ